MKFLIFHTSWSYKVYEKKVDFSHTILDMHPLHFILYLKIAITVNLWSNSIIYKNLLIIIFLHNV